MDDFWDVSAPFAKLREEMERAENEWNEWNDEFAAATNDALHPHESTIRRGRTNGKRGEPAEYTRPKTIRRETKREKEGRNGWSKSHTITTYTTWSDRRPLARARQRQNAIGAGELTTLVALFGSLGYYLREKTEFEAHYEATNLKASERLRLATAWPLLYASSRKFREEFRKAKDAAAASASSRKENAEKKNDLE